MFNLFDHFIRKDYHFVVKEPNLIEVMKIIHTSISNQKFNCGQRGMTIINKGIDVIENNEIWIEKINVTLTDAGWKSLISQCSDKGYKLIVKSQPDVMYFTKQES